MPPLTRQEATRQVEQERWQCRSCSDPLGPHDGDTCRRCKQYWEDVANGLFDDNPETF